MAIVWIQRWLFQCNEIHPIIFASSHFAEDPKDLIRKCLVVEPEKRITVKEALAHPFFTTTVRYIFNSNSVRFFLLDFLMTLHLLCNYFLFQKRWNEFLVYFWILFCFDCFFFLYYCNFIVLIFSQFLFPFNFFSIFIIHRTYTTRAPHINFNLNYRIKQKYTHEIDSIRKWTYIHTHERTRTHTKSKQIRAAIWTRHWPTQEEFIS